MWSFSFLRLLFVVYSVASLVSLHCLTAFDVILSRIVMFSKGSKSTNITCPAMDNRHVSLFLRWSFLVMISRLAINRLFLLFDSTDRFIFTTVGHCCHYLYHVTTISSFRMWLEMPKRRYLLLLEGSSLYKLNSLVKSWIVEDGLNHFKFSVKVYNHKRSPFKVAI